MHTNVRVVYVYMYGAPCWHCEKVNPNRKIRQSILIRRYIAAGIYFSSQPNNLFQLSADHFQKVVGPAYVVRVSGVGGRRSG